MDQMELWDGGLKSSRLHNFVTHKHVLLLMYFDFLCISWIENSEYDERSSSYLPWLREKRMLLKIVVPGGSLGQGFRFSQLALSISCCFFSTPGNSAKNSPENAPFMQTSANHHSWTVQVISIRTISSLWGEFSPVVSALTSFVSGSLDHFRLLNLTDKLPRAQPASGIAINSWASTVAYMWQQHQSFAEAQSHSFSSKLWHQIFVTIWRISKKTSASLLSRTPH